MDKYELVTDITDHPDKYSDRQLDEIMSDPESREIYNLISKTDSAIEACKDIDVDAEWEAFSIKHIGRSRHISLWPGSRAATIAAIICTSIVAVAGIAISVKVFDRKAEQQTVITTDALPDEVSGIPSETIQPADTTSVRQTPVIFEDTALETIMKAVAASYCVKIRINNSEAASLHLFYKLDPALPLDEIISQLNTFEQINITHNGDTLTID